MERALQGIIDTKMHINSTSYPMYAAAFELGWLDSLSTLASLPRIKACYGLISFLIQPKTAARQSTPMKDAAVFS